MSCFSGFTVSLGCSESEATATDVDTGTGVRPPATENSTWYTSHGARACGFPLVAGLIRMEEIEAGRIEHAMVMD
jgi:hypothetical protein